MGSNAPSMSAGHGMPCPYGSKNRFPTLCKNRKGWGTRHPKNQINNVECTRKRARLTGGASLSGSGGLCYRLIAVGRSLLRVLRRLRDEAEGFAQLVFDLVADVGVFL